LDTRVSPPPKGTSIQVRPCREDWCWGQSQHSHHAEFEPSSGGAGCRDSLNPRDDTTRRRHLSQHLHGRSPHAPGERGGRSLPFVLEALKPRPRRWAARDRGNSPAVRTMVVRAPATRVLFSNVDCELPPPSWGKGLELQASPWRHSEGRRKWLRSLGHVHAAFGRAASCAVSERAQVWRRRRRRRREI
jgi:hypothetical protein